MFNYSRQLQGDEWTNISMEEGAKSCDQILISKYFLPCTQMVLEANQVFVQ